MGMVLCSQDIAVFKLLANNRVGNPWFHKDLIELGSRLWIEVKHAVNNMSAFAWKQSQNAPRATDDFFSLGRRCCLLVAFLMTTVMFALVMAMEDCMVLLFLFSLVFFLLLSFSLLFPHIFFHLACREGRQIASRLG